MKRALIRFSTMLPALALAAAPLVLGACSGTVSVTPLPTVTEGTVTIDWTVSSVADPAQCAAFDAASFEAQVFDETGSMVADETAACDAFVLTIPLPDGTYSATVDLIDTTGTTVTTMLPLTDLEVVAGTDLSVSVDFPPTSHL